jgi:uncharacterized protein YpbB
VDGRVVFSDVVREHHSEWKVEMRAQYQHLRIFLQVISNVYPAYK